MWNEECVRLSEKMIECTNRGGCLWDEILGLCVLTELNEGQLVGALRKSHTLSPSL